MDIRAQHRENIRLGLLVDIVKKRDQKTGKLTRGNVRAILTSKPFHSRGIKVMLTSREVGRVFAIIDYTNRSAMKINVPQTKHPRVVIIGGGFAGLEIAKRLKDEPYQVVLIDQNNFHTFQPLLYQVATAGLEPDSIAFPIRKIFKKQSNFYFRMACAEKIISQENKIITSIGEIKYDHLIIATGSDTNFFGNRLIEENSMPMKSIVEALDLRSLILQNFEQALLVTDDIEKQRLMNIVVVGGGPTGVETAGALAELKKHILPKDYPELPINQMHIHLIEASPKLLNSFSEKSSQKTHKFLTEMEVHVLVNTAVLEFDGHTVKTKDMQLPARTLIWAAGVAGAVVKGIDASLIARGNRYIVDEHNRVKGLSNIYAIGDVAAMITDETPKGHPMVAPVAVQQATLLAENIIRSRKNLALKPFKYKDKGSMATIGRNKAVVDMNNFHTQGFLAWIMWMFVHLLLLIGFRNKMVVMVNWIWSYLIYDRGIRLIIRPFRKEKDNQNVHDNKEAA